MTTTTASSSYRDMVVKTPVDFRVRLRVYSDPASFDDEMKHIFERTGIYVAHESEIRNPADYVTTYMGRQPVIISRRGR
jgi:benzoate/toluate 1,2-dioxygenase alpha subunit